MRISIQLLLSVSSKFFTSTFSTPKFPLLFCNTHRDINTCGSLPHSLIPTYDHISHIIFCSFSLSFAYATQTHTHAHVPGNPSRGEHSTSGGQGFVSCYISWVALYWTLALPDGSPSDQDEWCLISPSAPTMPFHSIYVTNLSFSVAICYFTRAAVHFTYARVSAYGHTSDFHHHTTPPPPHRGGMLSPTVICVIRVYISYLKAVLKGE